MTLVDAGPLIALIDRDDADHKACVDVLKDLSAPLVTTFAAFTEAMYLLGDRGGWAGQDALWRLLSRGDLVLHTVEGETLGRARKLMKKYRDLPMDLADAMLVALAEELKHRRIFTLDGDFNVYRLPGRKAFEVVP